MSKDTTGTNAIQPAVNRRDFVKGSSVVAASTALASLSAKAATLPFSSSYGPLKPKACKATGLELLALPDGFEYTSYGWTGQIQSDRTPTIDHYTGSFRIYPDIELCR